MRPRVCLTQHNTTSCAMIITRSLAKSEIIHVTIYGSTLRVDCPLFKTFQVKGCVEELSLARMGPSRRVTVRGCTSRMNRLIVKEVHNTAQTGTDMRNVSWSLHRNGRRNNLIHTLNVTSLRNRHRQRTLSQCWLLDRGSIPREVRGLVPGGDRRRSGWLKRLGVGAQHPCARRGG